MYCLRLLTILLIVSPTVRISYAAIIDVGDPWTCDGSLVGMFANDGALTGGSGTVQDG